MSSNYTNHFFLSYQCEWYCDRAIFFNYDVKNNLWSFPVAKQCVHKIRHFLTTTRILLSVFYWTMKLIYRLQNGPLTHDIVKHCFLFCMHTGPLFCIFKRTTVAQVVFQQHCHLSRLLKSFHHICIFITAVCTCPENCRKLHCVWRTQLSRNTAGNFFRHLCVILTDIFMYGHGFYDMRNVLLKTFTFFLDTSVICNIIFHNFHK